MLKGEVYLDRLNYNGHKTLANLLVNISLDINFVEDALPVGELFDRLRCVNPPNTL